MISATEKAKTLGKSGLWRWAARCWLDVMDASSDDNERESIASHRQRCMIMASNITPEQQHYKNKQR